MSTSALFLRDQADASKASFDKDTPSHSFLDLACAPRQRIHHRFKTLPSLPHAFLRGQSPPDSYIDMGEGRKKFRHCVSALRRLSAKLHAPTAVVPHRPHPSSDLSSSPSPPPLCSGAQARGSAAAFRSYSELPGEGCERTQGTVCKTPYGRGDQAHTLQHGVRDRLARGLMACAKPARPAPPRSPWLEPSLRAPARFADGVEVLEGEDDGSDNENDRDSVSNPLLHFPSPPPLGACSCDAAHWRLPHRAMPRTTSVPLQSPPIAPNNPMAHLMASHPYALTQRYLADVAESTLGAPDDTAHASGP